MHEQTGESAEGKVKEIKNRIPIAVGGMASCMHCLAGSLLLVFSSSHFAFLTITGFSGTLPNQVFPFITSNELYLTAGFIEACIAFICFISRGIDCVNYFILSFVAMMLLYHWALSFTGANHCDCLGLLGRLLHVDKNEENTISYLALALLVSTTAPWLYANMKTMPRQIWKRLSIGLALLLVAQASHAESVLSQKIEIYGTYSGQDKNPATGKTYFDSPQTVEAAFRVVISGNEWNITATNLHDVNCPNINYYLKQGAVGRIWSDGTNTFTQQPTPPHNSNTNSITISPSHFYVSSFDPDFLDMSLPWLTFCVNPSYLSPAQNGVISLPVPWLQPRYKPAAYGYKWVINASDDNRFISTLSLVRDSELDLSDENALLRTEFIYPYSLGEYQLNKIQLNTLNKTPNDFIEADFNSTDWYNKSGIKIPAKSKLKCFWFSAAGTFVYPSFEGDLKVTSIVVSKDNKDNLFPSIDQPTKVIDFRYRKIGNGRIYRFAKYTLQPGESLKPSDDPELIAEVSYYLKHGPKYNSFLTNKHILVWLLFGVILIAPLVAILINTKHNRQK